MGSGWKETSLVRGVSAGLEMLRRPRESDLCYISIIIELQNHEVLMANLNKDAEDVVRFADMFSAMGTEARLRIIRLLLSAHPAGMVVGEIGSELGIPASTLSHHLDKLKNEHLVQVRRAGTFLHYTANTDALRELLGFLYAECCTRNRAVPPETIRCC
jgi:ArsR family transcriptional regulator, arsenate/arsenite/antimonite-responsive transcriptional repressor